MKQLLRSQDIYGRGTELQVEIMGRRGRPIWLNDRQNMEGFILKQSKISGLEYFAAIHLRYFFFEIIL